MLSEIQKFEPIESYLTKYQDTLKPNTFELILMQPPISGVQTQHFRIVLNLKDGSMFTDNDSLLLTNIQ